MLTKWYTTRESTTWSNGWFIRENSWISTGERRFLLGRILKGAPRCMRNCKRRLQGSINREKFILRIWRIWLRKSWCSLTLTRWDRQNLERLPPELFRTRGRTRSTGEWFTWLICLSTECWDIRLRWRCRSSRLWSRLSRPSKLQLYVLFYSGSVWCKNINYQIPQQINRLRLVVGQDSRQWEDY